ncbi:hypothetical protein C7974DRAFT_76654 [Boeremia exigua]|uniref:uncharacterized protein n=1 Tax=Boeremia exigua TaxID=749465 RepID=UPI001E8CE579|nr:uncharacterized protein C7974DRAFT_76654 [Boeremia exigua]KAH6613183.1 hypothetical protein C7974DRAFT_76654 [Boeremia exigua]
MMRPFFVLGLATFAIGAAAATVSTEDFGNITSTTRPLNQTEVSSLNTPTTSSPIVTTVSASKVQSSTLPSPSSFTSSGSPQDVARPGPSPDTPQLSSSSQRVSGLSSPASGAIGPVSSSTINSTASATPTEPTGSCKGCVLQAYPPITAFFNETDPQYQVSTSTTTMNATVRIIEYSDVNATELEIGGQTRTVIEGTTFGTITSSTPQFVITPTDGVLLTVNAGPTYVIYPGFEGGLNAKVEPTLIESNSTLQTCSPNVKALNSWQPTATEDWNYFIETYMTKPPEPPTETVVSVPSRLVSFLNQDADFREQFNGSDIVTCTVGPGTGVSTASTSMLNLASSDAATSAPGSQTFISTSYQTTSQYTTKQTCLRCVATSPVNPIVTAPSLDVPTPRVPNRQGNPVTPVNPQPPNIPGAPNRPEDPSKPVDQQQQNQPEPSIIIGGAVLPITTAQPAQNTDRPSGQNQNIPLVVIGSETVTPGETKTINGVTVFVPTEGSASGIVVGGSTVVLNTNTNPTGPAIPTIGSSTITANSQGEFVVDTATLKPEGLVIDGQTSSILRVPASNPINTTRSSVSILPASTSSSPSSSSTTSTRGAGDFVASGIGETGRARGGAGVRGVDRWIEGLMVGVAGWFIVLL